MKRRDSIGAALHTAALYDCGALCALLAVGALADCGWDVSGQDALLKLGVALGAFLSLALLLSAVWRTRQWVLIRRVNRLRVLNAHIRHVVFDDVVYTDFRDLPRFWRRQVRRELRHGVSDGDDDDYVGGPDAQS